MAILPRNWSWLSFLIGALAVQFVLPFLLGLLHRNSSSATAKSK